MPEDAIPSLIFDLSQMPPGERIERWRAQMAPIGELQVPDNAGTPDAPRPFEWTVQTQAWDFGGGMLFSAGAFGAQRMTRSPHLVRTEEMDHYTLQIAEGGDGIQMAAGDRRVSVGAGTPIMSDLARPKTLQHGASRMLSLFIPRAAIDALLPRPVELNGAVPTGACASLLTAHMRSLAARLPQMTRNEAPGAMSATLHLLAAALAPTTATLALARPAMENTLRRQISRYIHEHVADLDLSTDSLCRHFRISRSSLYRLFEPVGGVANHIKECRLKRIHELLSAPAQRIYLSRLASDHGFKNPAHFSRAFRQQYGYSPKDVALQVTVEPRSIDAGVLDTPAKWWRSVLG
ncbi:MAG: hypothetical protein JWR80_9580 [Bradyrhizobium sp.]|nr:hypothetical protein [Bradyrhizobium sp.]